MDVIFSSARAVHRPPQGYTLTELVSTLAIAGIVMALALPSFATLLQNNRLTTSVNTLASNLNYARSEAITRNQRIIVCKGTVEKGCDKHVEWHDGWIIFADLNGDKILNGEDEVLWTQAALSPTQTLTWSAFPSANYAIYYPNGTASSNGTFILCDERGAAAAKALIVAKTGRLRVSDKSAQGNALQCPP